jgi:hypothetical protein
MRVGEMLEPVVGAMRKELLAGSYIQADDSIRQRPPAVGIQNKRPNPVIESIAPDVFG